MQVDVLVAIEHNGDVSISGVSKDGVVFMADFGFDMEALQPDVVLSRIPIELTIGLAHWPYVEVYILRRPPLH